MRRLILALTTCVLSALIWHSAAAQEFRIDAEAPRFGIERPVILRLVGSDLEADGLRCRWILAHSDVGLRYLSDNRCELEVYIDPNKTRLSRFQHDRVMAVDVIVYVDADRVGHAAIKLEYVE